MSLATTAEDRGMGDPDAQAPARRPGIAFAMSLLCPGLGMMYAGHLVKAITVNLLFVLMVEAFVVSWTSLGYFPLVPLAVLATSWLVLTILSARHARELVEQGGAASKAYQHGVFYLIAGMLTYAVPLVVTVQFTRAHLWDAHHVRHDAMYPNVHAGDTVLVDRTVYRRRLPERGDLVAVRAPAGDALSVARVVGVVDDVVRLEGPLLFLNEEPVVQSPLGSLTGDTSPLWVESTDRPYVVSIAGPVGPDFSLPPQSVGDGEVFVLGDNRSVVGEGRGAAGAEASVSMGPVPLAWIAGEPVYIAWSHEPATGLPRWERIGLRTQ